MHVYEVFTTANHQNCSFRQPWVTPLIGTFQIRQKNLYNRTRRSDLVEDWNEYRAAKKLMQKECWQPIIDIYVTCSIQSLTEVIYKDLWSYVKCKKCDQVTIPPLDVNGLTISDSQEKANAINAQFLSIHIEEDVSTLPDLGTSPYDCIVTEDITVEDVAKLLVDLQSHKAHEHNKILARLLNKLHTVWLRCLL